LLNLHNVLTKLGTILYVQGRPVRALCDAYMHQGQTRWERKTHKVAYVKNT